MEHYTIDRQGRWHLYTLIVPQRGTALGTVTRQVGDTGALVKMSTGLYVQVNAGVVRTLDQQAVRRALAPTPRPAPPR